LTLFFAALAQVVSLVPPEKIDLTIANPCEEGSAVAGEIVVCGRRGDGSDRYRIKQPSADNSESRKAQVQLADGIKASAETENYDVGGFPSKRLMVRLKIKF